MNLVLNSISKIQTFYGIHAKIGVVGWEFYNQVHKNDRGIYVIWHPESNDVIYVGKGNIKRRQLMHKLKTYDTPTKSTVVTKGWQWLRENYSLKTSEWELVYVPLEKETELSALEGGLIHVLQPLANDETFKDENRVVNG